MFPQRFPLCYEAVGVYWCRMVSTFIIRMLQESEEREKLQAEVARLHNLLRNVNHDEMKLVCPLLDADECAQHTNSRVCVAFDVSAAGVARL